MNAASARERGGELHHLLPHALVRRVARVLIGQHAGVDVEARQLLVERVEPCRARRPASRPTTRACPGTAAAAAARRRACPSPRATRPRSDRCRRGSTCTCLESSRGRVPARPPAGKGRYRRNHRKRSTDRAVRASAHPCILLRCTRPALPARPEHPTRPDLVTCVSMLAAIQGGAVLLLLSVFFAHMLAPAVVALRRRVRIGPRQRPDVTAGRDPPAVPGGVRSRRARVAQRAGRRHPLGARDGPGDGRAPVQRRQFRAVRTADRARPDFHRRAARPGRAARAVP